MYHTPELNKNSDEYTIIMVSDPAAEKPTFVRSVTDLSI